MSEEIGRETGCYCEPRSELGASWVLVQDADESGWFSVARYDEADEVYSVIFRAYSQGEAEWLLEQLRDRGE